jgi:catechol 2,3-dioxygenase-like lactoylglutathione lyase family enzyme
MELGHIALTVESLRQAENLYKRLFDLKVLFREGMTDQGRLRWEGDIAWQERGEEGVVEKSCLESQGIRLMLLLKTDDFASQSRIDHICLKMNPDFMSRAMEQARALDCRIDRISSSDVVIEDPYGVRWRILLSE